MSAVKICKYLIGRAPVLCLLALASGLFTAPADAQSLARERADRLQRGINTSHWFAQSGDYSRQHLETHTSSSDLALIREMGFDHVRLSIEPKILATLEEPTRLDPSNLRLLRQAIADVLENDLAVMVDIHPASSYKHQLADSPEAARAFARFWGELAGALSDFDPERVFFEILNEPEVEDRSLWESIQEQSASAIRRAAPRHTIIATGHRWSGPQQLVQLTPLTDPNIIYAFHYYRPHTFTHQGASWGADFWPHITRLPYPSTPAAVAATAETIDDSTARQAVEEYGRERWDGDKILGEIAEVAAWGERHGVPIVCNEFGVYRRHSDPAHRAAWLEDVRNTLEQYGIPWAMWDYQGGFSVVNGDEEKTPDETTLEALGLE